MTPWKALIAFAVCATPLAARAQAPDVRAAGAQIVKADAEFARAVAERNTQKFLSFIAEATTFNGGSPNELRGRDAVMKGWADFFEPDGPTLTWQPIKGEVVGAGDVGYTTGRSVFRSKGADGKMTERRGEYITVWKKQADGSWKVVFDTGSTLPAARTR
jgi:ketosteroid isomerase-like protein